MSLLRINTLESYHFKILAELLQKCIKEAAFVVDKDGIRLTCIDKKSDNGTLCIDMNLCSNNFPIFKCANDRFVLGVTMLHFHQQLKNIKKKDSLTLEVQEAAPQKLLIKIHQGSNANAKEAIVQITNVQPVDIDVQGGYDKPIVCPSREFAELRTLHRIGQVITMRFTKTWAKFYCGDIIHRTVTLGEFKEDEENDKSIYHQHEFTPENLTQLVKISKLSTNVQLYVNEELPLKIKMNVGTLGTLSIFLKSIKQIEREEEETGCGADDGDDIVD